MIKNYLSLNEISSSIKDVLMPENPDQKAVLALLVLFIFFLAFSVISGAGILRLRAGQNRPSDQAVTRELASFYKNTAGSIDFPQSSMTAGSMNPKLKIYVFTDFLCSACYKFYKTEKYILAKYGDRVQFVYYHYPLDSTCNKYFDDSLYPESCTASRSMYAAAKAGFFEEYFFMHFHDYKQIKENYDEKTARDLAAKTSARFRIEDRKLKAFTELFDASNFPDEILNNIEFAEKMKIGGTPTIYISGRELNGVPHQDVLEAIILSELNVFGK
jgi:protein-disulfide isomerase